MSNQASSTGVKSIAKSGSAKITGDATLSEGANVTLTQSGKDIAIAASASGSGAPADATYIVQTANATLSAEQALGALATGIVKNTTTTGVLSIAAEGTDYWKPGGTDVAVADGGTGASSAATALSNLGGIGATTTDTLQNKTITNANNTVGAGTFTNPYKFAAYHNTTQNITTAGATVAFNTEHFDTGGNFASNTFTAPVAGFYQFSAQTAWAATASQTRCVLTLECSGTSGSKTIGDKTTGAAANGFQGTILVQLAASETVTVKFTPVGATTTLRAGPSNTWFTGHLVSVT